MLLFIYTISSSVFECLGFTPLTGTHKDNKDDGISLHPPDTEPSSPEGKRNRARLLRAWVEIGSWLTIFYKARDSKFLLLSMPYSDS